MSQSGFRPGYWATTLALFALITLVLLACGSDAGGETAVDEPAHGGAPPVYSEPKRLTPGRFDPPIASAGAFERGLAASEADSAKPRFEGTVSDIRLYSLEELGRDPAARKVVCAGGRIKEFRPTDELQFAYLPPGTFAIGPQSAAICDDGSVASFGQQFNTDTATFDVWFTAGERAFGHDAPEDRVSAGKVNGRDAVIIRPITEEGFGRAWIAIATEHGLIIVDARELPADQVRQIAEGITCSSC